MRLSAILLSTAIGLAAFTTGCDEGNDPAPTKGYFEYAPNSSLRYHFGSGALD